MTSDFWMKPGHYVLCYVILVLIKTCFSWLSLVAERSGCFVAARWSRSPGPHLPGTDTQGGSPLLVAEEGREFRLPAWCPLTLSSMASLSLAKGLTPHSASSETYFKPPTWSSQPRGRRGIMPQPGEYGSLGSPLCRWRKEWDHIFLCWAVGWLLSKNFLSC